MTTLELLQQHPKTTSLIKDWYLDKLLKSMDAATEVPDDFKEMMKAQPIDSSNIAKMIDGIPRSLFDFFDEHEIYINVNKGTEIFMSGYTDESGHEHIKDGAFDNRKDADMAMIKEAFKLVEEKL